MILHRLLSAITRQERSKLNENFDRIERSYKGVIDTSSEAKQISERAESKIDDAIERYDEATSIAGQAETTANATAQQLKNIILESGTSDAELVAMRTNTVSGESFNTAGERADIEIGRVNDKILLQMDTQPINTLFPPDGLEAAQGDNFASLLNNIIEYAISSGREVEIQQGAYKVDSPINLRTGLKLRGLGNVRLEPAVGYNGKIFENQQNILQDNIYIENITIVGNSATVALDFYAIARSTLKKVRVLNCLVALQLVSTNSVNYAAYNRFTECRFDHNDKGVLLHAHANGWVNHNSFVQTDIDHNRINVHAIADTGGSTGQVIQNNFSHAELEGYEVEQAIIADGNYIELHFNNCWFEPMATTKGVISAVRRSTLPVEIRLNGSHGLSNTNFRIYKGNLAHTIGGAKIFVNGESIDSTFSFYQDASRINLFANSALVANGVTAYNNPKIDGVTYASEHETVRWVDCGKVYRWSPNTQYRAGDFIIPLTSNGRIYKITNGGTSGATEPAWATNTLDGTLTLVDAGDGLLDDVGALRIKAREWAGVKFEISLAQQTYVTPRKFAITFFVRGDANNASGVTSSSQGTLNGFDNALKTPPNHLTYNRHVGTLSDAQITATTAFYNVYASTAELNTIYIKEVKMFELLD